MKLRQRLMLGFGGCATILFLIMATLIMVVVQFTMTEIMMKSVSSTTKEIGYSLNSYFTQVETVTNLVFADSKSYNYTPRGSEYIDYDRVGMENEITTYLSNLSSFNNYSDFAIVYYDDSYLGSLSKTTETNYVDEPLYETLSQKVEKQRDVWFTGDHDNYKRIYFTKRLNSGAIVLSSLFYRDLDTVFTMAEGTEGVIALLINEDDTIIYSSNQERIGRPFSFEGETRIMALDAITYMGERFLRADYKCKNGWTLVTLYPTDTMFYVIRTVFIVTITVLLICILVFAIASYRLVSTIQRPINMMTSAISEVEAGNFDVKMPETHTKEIQELSDGLGKMVVSVKENIDAVEKANQEKSKFLANTSHEIRTPMNAIMGYSDMIIEDSHEPASVENAKTIRQAAKNLLTIVNDILDFSKIEAGKIDLKEDEYRIKNVQEEVYGIIRIPAEKKELEFSFELQNQFPAILYGDDIKLRQILINIANNAIKFTNRGYVRISGKCKRLDRDLEHVEMTFRVMDSGIGIREEDLAKVFNSFEQVDKKKNRKTEGSGLGLSIAKEFAHMMGGDITVESEYGRGTIFTVTVLAKIVAWDAEDEKPVDVKGRRILIADDNETNLVMFKRMMDPYEVVVETASNGTQVLERNDLTTFDLIFMDHLMPDYNGDEVTREIRARASENPKYKEIKIVGYTADTDGDVNKAMIGAGMNDCVVKPISVNKLEAIFRKFLVLIIAFGLFLPLKACANPFTPVDLSDDGVTISCYWWGNDARTEYMLNLIDRFEEAYPDIHVECHYSEECGSNDRVAAGFYSNTEADVMQINYDWLKKYSPDGTGFYDLSKVESLDLSSFSEQMLTSGQSGGVQNAIVLTMDMPVVYINWDYAKSQNCEIPSTWKELNELKFNYDIEYDYPLAIDTPEKSFMFLVSYTEQKTGKKAFDENGNLLFGEEEYKVMLREYKDLMNYRIAQIISSTSIDHWKEGTALLTVDWISNADKVVMGAPKNANIGVQSMFEDEIKGNQASYMYPRLMYAMRDDVEHPEEAGLLLSYILNEGIDLLEMDMSQGIPMDDQGISKVMMTRSTDLSIRAANEGYLTDYSFMEISLSDPEIMSVFEDLLIELGYGKINVQTAAELMAENMP